MYYLTKDFNFRKMRTRDVRILDPVARQKRAERWVASLNRVNYRKGKSAYPKYDVFNVLDEIDFDK